MKIGFFIFHLRSGGAERVISTLANIFVKQQNEVNIYTISEEKSFYEINGKVNHVKLGIQRNAYLGKLNILKQLQKLYVTIRQDKPDVLISFIDKNNLLAIVVGKLLGIPVIISERSNPEKYNFGPVILKGFKVFYKRADAIVLQTKAVGNGFKNMNIQLPKSFVIPNPLDPVFFSNDKPVKENIILSIGRLSKEKGHDILLHALVGIDLKDWKVIIIGDGPLLNEYKKFVQVNKLAHNVTFEGRKENVIDYYNRAKIFILPSRFEGFPNALLEALSRACVAISSDCDYGPAEIIDNGKNGYLFKVEEADELRANIVRLITNTELIDNMSNIAVESVKNYTAYEISNHWLEVIRKVV